MNFFEGCFLFIKSIFGNAIDVMGEEAGSEMALLFNFMEFAKVPEAAILLSSGFSKQKCRYVSYLLTSPTSPVGAPLSTVPQLRS